MAYAVQSSAHLWFTSTKTEVVASSRDEHKSGPDRTGSGLNPILAGSGLNWTVIFVNNWRIRTGSDREILDIPM